MQEWIAPGLAGVLALLALVLVVLLVRERARTVRELRAAHAETAALRAQVDEIERRLAAPPSGQRAHPEYVITHLGEHPEEGAPEQTAGETRIDRALFADLVLRETVVKAAALTHGVRRALDPETRNRIRFEVRRQTRAARKQRRRDLRDLARRQRAGDPTLDPRVDAA